MLPTIGLLAAGLLILALGAEALVRGAVRLARALRLSSLFIGLTLVAYGTSAPELVVSVFAGLRTLPGIAAGNAIGSNIFNVGVAIGLSALVSPMACRPGIVRREVLVVIATTVVLLLMVVLGQTLVRWEAAGLLLMLVAMTVWSYHKARHVDPPEEATADPAAGVDRSLVSIVLVVVGLLLLVLGGRWVVTSAVQLAGTLGLSTTVIGLTIVAIGTSLPELATSVVAAIRGEPEIAIGNVLGSNVFNLAGVLGITGLLRPLTVPESVVRFDLPVALLFALACIPIGLTGRRISRLEGGALLAGYILYTALLILRST